MSPLQINTTFGITLACILLTTFVLFRLSARNRVRLVTGWVREELQGRFGVTLRAPSINCTENRQWPILVVVDCRPTGELHRIRYSCTGARDTLKVTSETQGLAAVT